MADWDDNSASERRDRIRSEQMADGRKAILARLRNPDDALVEAVAASFARTGEVNAWKPVAKRVLRALAGYFDAETQQQPKEPTT